LNYKEIKFLARCYLDALQLRDSIDKRLAHLETLNKGSSILEILKEHREVLESERKKLLKEAKNLFENHLIWKYCQKIKGMGEVAALTFLGYIDPYKVTSAGQVRAYFGVAPQTSKESGEISKWNREAKGRLWLIIRNVIMAKDPYYYPLYLQKKQWYLTREYGKYIENAELCPHYKECYKRLFHKAARLNRPIKKPPCKAHVNNLAIRWLMGIIVNHAAELLRRAEGLGVSAWKSHSNYIPPPI